MQFEWRLCERPSCQFRFPVTDDRQTGESCPLCQSPTAVAASASTGSEMLEAKPATGTAVAALLDNLRSVYNVGSIFRTADGAGLAHLHLCGITPPPTHPKIAKTALGAEAHIPWTQHKNGVETALRLQQTGWQIWALEEGETAVPLFTCSAPAQPVLLVVGNEIAGIDPGLLTIADEIVSLPMLGVKRSLNVATAFGVAAYFLRFQRGDRK
ncbi:MAG: RNA methyltransferase [Anaerolineae bacterium]